MFSVVIPLYNKAHTIKGTIISLMKQEFKDFEIIVVDDGSTDNSLEIVGALKVNRCITIVSQKNGGVSSARNLGISLAKYDYIALLDADDEWVPDYLKQIKIAIDKFPGAGFYGAYSLHRDFETGEQSCKMLPKFKGKISRVDYLSDPHSMPHTSAMILSKKHFLQIDTNGEGFPVGMKVCEDWACFYRLSFIADFVFVGFPLGIRNTNVAGQITGISRDQRFALMIHVVKFYNITFDGWKNSKLMKELYPKFLKYDLRARIFASIRSNEYWIVDYLMQGLSNDILYRFNPLEISLYKSEKLKLLSLFYISLTKIVWKIGRLLN